MKDTKQFIEKAIEGGWGKEDNLAEMEVWASNDGEIFCDNGNGISARYGHVTVSQILLDPLAWQAVGKVEGWGTYDKGYNTPSGNNVIGQVSLLNMHKMIEALWEGKTIEEFLQTL